MRFVLGLSLTTIVCLASSLTAADQGQPDKGQPVAGELALKLRYRTPSEAGSSRFHVLTRTESWQPSETAVVICDMWDSHHCLNAVRRVKQMAPRMNQVVHKLRARGVTVIHAPSSCMGRYQDHPARLNASGTPRSENLPQDIGKWCYSIPEEEQGEYPIDQTDGGEDDDPAEHEQWVKQLQSQGLDPRRPWQAQTDLIDIHDDDFISDNGEEIWSVMETRGIKNVVLVGVHTNMCVLGRPFGLRQMAKNGKNVVLMRDMTDTMYNPLRRPQVSHFSGTDLIVEHIEKWVCPTITSDQILGGTEFRFSLDRRPHLVMVVGEREYLTNESLPRFAAQHLQQDMRISFVFANPDDRNDFPGMEVLDEADAVLISVRRRVLPPQQLAAIRRFVESGRPVLGIRTASHAFSLRGKAPPEGLAGWETWDGEVYGGNYSNHHGNEKAVRVSSTKATSVHPIMQGVAVGEIKSNGSLYVVSPLAETTTALLEGTVEGERPEPIAWTNTNRFGGRSFYTSLGHIDDFNEPAFNQMLAQAIRWAVGI